MARHSWLLPLFLGATLLLTGCMEALRTNTPGGALTAPPSSVTPQFSEQTDTPVSAATPVALSPVPTDGNQPTAQPTDNSVPTAISIPEPTAAPTVAGQIPTLAVVTPTPSSNLDRWRAQQLDRQPFPEPQRYTTGNSELWWYDPINQQSVVLGSFAGEFVAQAQFTRSGPTGGAALEVLYTVNQDYGLTALSPATLERIRAAGYGESIETYVMLTPDVTPLQ